MKQLFLTSVLALSFLLPVSAMAQASMDQYAVHVPSEISALLLNSDYAQVLAQTTDNAATKGRVLRITKIQKFSLNDSQWLEVILEERSTANFNWSPGGSIMASFTRGPMGLVSFDGIYYKPDAIPPGGGASVGNN